MTPSPDTTASSAARPIVMLTDFGVIDDFAGICHAVLASHAPHSPVIALTHGVEPHNIVQGALLLRHSLAYVPRDAVMLAVVDPGVGTERRSIAVEAADGRLYVGPDNGLLEPAVTRAGGALRLVRIIADDIILSPTSATFHGRDVFAPAAAHLARGGDLADLGPDLDPSTLTTLELPELRYESDHLIATVWHVDRFGNMSLNIDEAGFVEAFGNDGHDVELAVRHDRFYASVRRTFADVSSGALLLYPDPYGSMSIAINQGDAADMFRLAPGAEVGLRRAESIATDVAAMATRAMHPQGS